MQRQQCQSRAVLIARKLQIRIVKETRQKAREFLSQQHTPSGGDKGGRDIMVAIAAGIHLFPFRTEKLSPRAPMILLYQVGKWVAANLKRKALQSAMTAGLFCFPAEPENKQCITSAPHCLVVHAAAAAELHAPFGRGPVALLSLLDRIITSIDPDGASWCAQGPVHHSIGQSYHDCLKGELQELSIL